MSFTTILVPLDGSEFAFRALERAAALARHDNGRVLLLGVVEVPIAHFEGYGEFVAGLDVHEKLRENVSIALHKTAATLSSDGIRAEAPGKTTEVSNRKRHATRANSATVETFASRR